MNWETTFIKVSLFNRTCYFVSYGFAREYGWYSKVDNEMTNIPKMHFSRGV